MAVPENKDELIKAIISNYKKLTQELSDIQDIVTEKKVLEGHYKNSFISINNLIAYLIGWGKLVLKWNDKKSRGLVVNFPDTGFKWNELGLLAQKFYNDYESKNFKTLTHELDKTVNEILVLIDGKTNDELYLMPWYNKWTLGKMIQLNTSAPYKNATNRLRKWKKASLLK